jgi:hypothetical protein
MGERNEDQFDYSNVVVSDATRLVSIANQLVNVSRNVVVHHDGENKHLRGVVFDTSGVRCVLGEGDGGSNVEAPMVDCMDLREAKGA